LGFSLTTRRRRRTETSTCAAAISCGLTIHQWNSGLVTRNATSMHSRSQTRA
jgi:hypothetical protein